MSWWALFVCQQCGVEFKAQREPARKYCSVKCRRKAMAAVQAVLTCATCGKPFVVKRPSNIATRKYCSLECVNSNPERRKVLKANTEQMMRDPVHKARVLAAIAKGIERRWADPKNREEMSRLVSEQWATGIRQPVAYTEEGKARRVEAMRRPEVRAKLAERSRSRFLNPEWKAAWYERRWTDAHKTLFSDMGKARFADKEWTHAWSLTMQMRPNNLEADVLTALEKRYPGAWRYNDGGTIIAGKIPDFIRTDGIPICVDAFGDYWHAGEDPQPRVDHFADHGYTLVVVWESEFRRDPSILLSRLDEAFREELVA